jgi:hypothetical protein
MQRTGRSRAAGAENALRLTIAAGISVVDVAAVCLPYAAEAASDAARAAWRRIRRQGGVAVRTCSADQRGGPA